MFSFPAAANNNATQTDANVSGVMESKSNIDLFFLFIDFIVGVFFCQRQPFLKHSHVSNLSES